MRSARLRKGIQDYYLGISSEGAVPFFTVFLGLTFELKLGALCKDNEYGYLYILSSLEKKYSGFKNRYAISGFLSWLVEGVWEEQAIIKEISHVGKEKESLAPSELLLLSSVLTLSDEELNAGFEEALSKGYSGNLTLKEYDMLLTRIANCNELKITINQKIDTQRLIEGINNPMGRIVAGEDEDEPQYMHFDGYILDNLPEDQKQIVELLDRFETEKIKYKYRFRFIKAYREGGENEIANINAEKNYYFDEDMARVVSTFYRENTNQEYRFEFVSRFTNKYKNAFFSGEKERSQCCESLKLLKTNIMDIERKQQTEKALDALFIRDLERIIIAKEKMLFAQND